MLFVLAIAFNSHARLANQALQSLRPHRVVTRWGFYWPKCFDNHVVNTLNFLDRRRSVRAYLPTPVSDDLLAELLVAARLAPISSTLNFSNTPRSASAKAVFKPV